MTTCFPACTHAPRAEALHREARMLTDMTIRQLTTRLWEAEREHLALMRDVSRGAEIRANRHLMDCLADELAARRDLD